MCVRACEQFLQKSGSIQKIQQQGDSKTTHFPEIIDLSLYYFGAFPPLAKQKNSSAAANHLK